MRHVSTLQQDNQFNLERQEALAGFVGFYRNKYQSKGLRPLDFLWNVYGMLLLPKVSGKELSAANLPKSLKESTAPDHRTSLHTKSTLYRINAQKKFTLKANLMGVASVESAISGVLEAWEDTDPTFKAADKEAALDNKTVSEYVVGRNWDTVFTGEQLASRMSTTQRGREILREAVESVSLEKIGNKLSLVFRFNISFKEAEYLNQTPVLDIQNANFYSFLFAWVSSNLATDAGADVAPYSVPMTKISSTVQEAIADKSAVVNRRVGEDNIVVDHLGDFLFIPDVDNTGRYEQELAAFGARTDGSFSFDQGSGEGGPINFVVNDPNAPRRKLPANMPLLTDWVNRRFAYVNSSGNVDTIDLGLCTPLANFHIRGLFDTMVSSTDKATPLGYALFLAEATKPGFMALIRPTNEEMDPRLWSVVSGFVGKPDLLNILPEKVERFRTANNLPVSELFETQGRGVAAPIRAFSEASSITEFRFIGRIIKEAGKILQENLEVIFRRYSVNTVLSAIATLNVFNKYIAQYDVVVTKDKADRESYIDQGLDENYVAKALPNFRKDVAFMPHQAAANNKMRRGPKHAIYEVDAGGGKTMMILTNILQELREKKCRRPIIACPPHLVSSYVKEAVYFTEGKVNLIPITNISLKQHGEERLGQLINKAPINTIFITDFDFIKNKSTDVAYGNKMLTVYKNAEFLRRFEFDLICIDESHYLRAPSLRTKAAQSFVSEIPMKRLASGTFIADTLADVAPQFGLFDPSVFGTRDQFIKNYSAEMKGNKVVAWREGAERAIRQKMEEHCVIVKHKRKEWAALLPEPVEEFFGVELTNNQRALYEAILTKTMEILREAIAKDPELREALESNDDSKVEELQFKLKRYLARLEAFLSTPESDEAGKDFLLLPEDKVSPKVLKIYERIRHHTEQGIPGKILIFTNYLAAAESVFNNAPPDIKKRMIHYTADNKMECKTQFETVPTKDIMVGVETSMNTGLNLQFCSRLIRMETVWTPGVLEQGNARVNRPNVKKKETREKIYFDWIVINKTIDVTKISRLISKMISKAKFDEYDNPAYDEIPPVPQIAMTMDTIEAHNDFEGSLLPYLESYEKMKQIQKADFDDYKTRNDGKLDPVPILAAGLLPDSKLMTRVPYIPDMEIYGENELGLVRYDQFVHQDAEALDGDDDGEYDAGDEEGDVIDPKYAKLFEERSIMKGQPVHTEWGDGVITGLGKRRVRVLFSDGTRKPINKLSVYVITRSSTNSIDMRAELLKEVGDLPLTEPFNVPVEEGAANKKRRNPDIKGVINETPTAEFDITVINDYLAVAYRAQGQGDKMIGRLTNIGFVKSPDYYFTKVIGPRNLFVLFKEWKDAGFKMDPKTSLVFQNVHRALKGDKKAATNYGFATNVSLKNWLRSTIKPTSDPKEIHPYPIVQDNNLFVALPLQGQPGTRGAIKHQPMNVRWKLGGGEDEVLRFVTKHQEIIQVLKQIKEAGIEIGNLDELKSQYDDYKQVRPRED